MSDILTREEFQLACACGEDDDIICIERHDLAQRAEIAELKTEFTKMDLMRLAAEAEVDIQDAQIAALQEALAQIGHEDWCASHYSDDPPCDCRLSTLSDAVERGKKLIEQGAEIGRLVADQKRLADNILVMAQELGGDAPELPELVHQAALKIERLRKAAQNFIDKVTEVGKVVDGIIGVQAARGYPYTGPNWSVERAALTEALSGSRPSGEGEKA